MLVGDEEADFAAVEGVDGREVKASPAAEPADVVQRALHTQVRRDGPDAQGLGGKASAGRRARFFLAAAGELDLAERLERLRVNGMCGRKQEKPQQHRPQANVE